MSDNRTHPSRAFQKPEQFRFSFRVRLEQLENRTLLSGACEASQCPDPNLPPTPPDEPGLVFWIDQWFWWNQSTEWNVGNDLPAMTDFESNQFGDNWFDGGEFPSWQDNGLADDLRPWMDTKETRTEFNEPPPNEGWVDTLPDMSPVELGELLNPFGENRGLFDGSDGLWRDHDPFGLPPSSGDFGGQAPNGVELGEDNWIDPYIDPGQPPSPPPWRPPRVRIPAPAGPIVIPPSHSTTQVSAAVLLPTNLPLIPGQAHKMATYEAPPYFAVDFAGTDELSNADADPPAEDPLAEVAAGSPSEDLTESETTSAEVSTAQTPKSTDDAPTVAATARDIAVAGAFAVVLSPPISRLLAASGTLAADDAIGGTIQALWAWLRRRKLKRPNSKDAPHDSNESDDSYASVDTAIRDLFDALTPRSNLALAGGAGAAGVAAIASLWSQYDPSRSIARGCSHRKLILPTNDGPTHVR